MKTRVISGIFLLAILLPTLIVGGDFMLAVIAVVSTAGIYELLKAHGQHKKKISSIAYLANVLFYLMIFMEVESFFIVELIVVFLLLLVSYVISYPDYKFTDVAIPLVSFVYAGVFMSYIYRIRSIDEDGAGVYLVCLVFICSWLCDTCAYFSGVTLGKHKAFPKLSPKKTWEGCIGGVLGATVIGTVLAFVFSSKLTVFTYPVLEIAAITFIGSVLSIFGDLAASAVKRENGLKDYSNLIPGHGGIMDRFDSVIFISPVIYYMINVFSKVL